MQDIKTETITWNLEIGKGACTAHRMTTMTFLLVSTWSAKLHDSVLTQTACTHSPTTKGRHQATGVESPKRLPLRKASPKRCRFGNLLQDPPTTPPPPPPNTYHRPPPSWIQSPQPTNSHNIVSSIHNITSTQDLIHKFCKYFSKFSKILFYKIIIFPKKCKS